MADLYPVYMDIGGVRTKVTAYKDIEGVRTLISSAESTSEVLPTDCLTFSSAEAFTIATKNARKNWDGALYYSTDTTTWSEWDGTTAISSEGHDGEQRIYMRGSGNSKITGYHLTAGTRWTLTGSDIACYGNIENLLDYETVANGEHPTMAKYCYYYMFSNCTSLVSAPELPATTLTNAYCYQYMFSNCTSLVSAPELPATTLSDSCYNYMFHGCTSLVNAPKLPATTLTNSCYNGMFGGCTSLATAPELPATTLAKICYKAMFSDCTSLTSVPELPSTVLAEKCYWSMFEGCTNIMLSTTQTGEYTTEYRIPTSGTGATATDALLDMFTDTGGTFTGTPTINTTYYTGNTVV